MTFVASLDKPPKDTSSVDRAIEELKASSAAWVRLHLLERIGLLERLKPRILAEAESLASEAAQRQEVEPSSPFMAEEWILVPWAFLQGVNSYLTTLRRIALGRSPVSRSAVRLREDGRTLVRVFPVSVTDRLLFSGYGAEAWLEPGVTPEQALREAAAMHRGAGFERPGVALVLGAGNVGSITALDILHALYSEGHAVIVKMNPVNDYLGKYFERIFAEYIERGWLRFVYGDAALGSYLAYHPGVSAVHMTGSAATHDAIVWGVGEEGEKRRRANAPRLSKPMTSELGGLSPLIVVPGDWSPRDLRFQAEHVVTSKLNNAGHNCIATQVLVLPEPWEQADRFLFEIRAVLESLPPRHPYYPRAAERMKAAMAGHSDAETYGDGTCVVVPNLDLGANESLLRDEVFGGALGIVRLKNRGVRDYLESAVAFVNERLPGTLGATLLIDPATAKGNEAVLEAALSDLRYGSIGINAWCGLGFLLGYTPWGAYPGHTLQNIGSGIGFVHNAFLLKHVQKTVSFMPFRPVPRSLFSGDLTFSPKPPFFVTNRTGLTTAKRLVEFLATDRISSLPGIFASALRG